MDDNKIKFYWMLVEEEKEITALRSAGKYLGVDTLRHPTRLGYSQLE
jgi:hypothetical protein